jgi:hypothetical protein
MKIEPMGVNLTICAVTQRILPARAKVGSASRSSRIDENLRQFYDSALAIVDNATELYQVVQPHAD